MSRRVACQVDIILLPLQGVCLLLHLYIPKVSLRLPWAMYVSRLPFQGVCFVITSLYPQGVASLALGYVRFTSALSGRLFCYLSVLRLTCAAPADDAFGLLPALAVRAPNGTNCVRTSFDLRCSC